MVETTVEKSVSEGLFERAQNILPSGVNSPVRAFKPYPFFVKSAQGSRLTSVDGNSFIDYCMAYGPMILGHSFEGVLDVAKAQLSKGTLYGAPTEKEVKLGELVRELFPSMEMLRMVNSGTEATMHAIRLARGFTGKNKIIKFEGCYHGAHDYVLVKAGSGATSFGAPDSLGIPQETTKNTIVLPYNNLESLEDTLKQQSSDIAAVIVEPVIGNAGLILPQKDYLQNLRRLTKTYGVLLIFDEVITGFRLALGGAQEYFQIKPDLTTLGKILGGGFPIGMFGGRKEIMQHLSPSGKVYQAGTFSGNPVSVSAGYAVVQTLQKNKDEIYPKLEHNCEILTKAVADSASDHRLTVHVNNIASMFQVFFAPKPVTDYASAKCSDTKKFYVYFKELLKSGVFVPPSQFETCFLSTAHTQNDLQKTVDAVDCALAKVSAECGCVA
ncbi:MAG: glutamate-1-semialdehyde 2,1-aminomutase [Candidatus Bathyarchaeota archaeon]|nr:glutamate-1-semialdehyde 2,1-aminomutase [Candidatus Bathyarchaeota archaeon]